MKVVQFDAVGKSRAGRLLLDALSFELETSEIFGLIGPNGSGKSTAVSLLCGRLEPDSGTIRLPVPAASLIGYCPQELALYRDLLPAENLRLFARLHGVPVRRREARIAELMSSLGLDAHAGTPAGALSGGSQRRMSIGCALAHEPQVVVLDEPSAGLDLEARRAVATIETAQPD